MAVFGEARTFELLHLILDFPKFASNSHLRFWKDLRCRLRKARDQCRSHFHTGALYLRASEYIVLVAGAHDERVRIDSFDGRFL